VADLVDHLEIPRTRLGVVSVGGVLVKADTRLKDRDCVRVFQPIAGG
jgi:sulfur carrier protein ThiS